MKLVVNKCYGGFGFSVEATLWLRERGQQDALEAVMMGEKYEDGTVQTYDFGSYIGRGAKRDDPLLIECVELFGTEKASGSLAQLAIVEIPDGIEWEIDEYDGIETVHEVRRSW